MKLLKFLDGSKGFTLIELLVVIAVIGLITSIIVVGIAERDKDAQDSAIIGELDQIRKQVEQFYVNNDGYQGLCAPDDTLIEQGRLGDLEDSIESKGGEIRCEVQPSEYAITSSLKQGDYWCVDSHGASREVSNHVSSTECP